MSEFSLKIILFFIWGERFGEFLFRHGELEREIRRVIYFMAHLANSVTLDQEESVEMIRLCREKIIERYPGLADDAFRRDLEKMYRERKGLSTLSFLLSRDRNLVYSWYAKQECRFGSRLYLGIYMGLGWQYLRERSTHAGWVRRPLRFASR